MANTHFIYVPKEEFDDLKIGDRVVIGNNEEHLCYVTYITETEGDENE